MPHKSDYNKMPMKGKMMMKEKEMPFNKLKDKTNKMMLKKKV